MKPINTYLDLYQSNFGIFEQTGEHEAEGYFANEDDKQVIKHFIKSCLEERDKEWQERLTNETQIALQTAIDTKNAELNNLIK